MLRLTLIIAISLFLVSCGSGPDQSTQAEKSGQENYDFPWYNPEISFEERVKLLINEMTLEEKISQMTHDAAPIERLGVTEYNWWSEALHGGARAGRATVFRLGIGLGARWGVVVRLGVAGAVGADPGNRGDDIAQRCGIIVVEALARRWPGSGRPR